MDRFLETAGLGSIGGWLRRTHKGEPEFEPGEPCANCATPLQGPWCYACGQGVEDRHRSIWKLIVDGFESLFHTDGRLWNTLPDLVLHPGRLTRAYLDGHRVPQVPPFRMFLVVLLIVFFTGHVSTSKKEEEHPARSGVRIATFKTPQQAKHELEALRQSEADLTARLGPEKGAQFKRRMAPVERQLERQAGMTLGEIAAEANSKPASARPTSAAPKPTSGAIVTGDTDGDGKVEINLDKDPNHETALEHWLQVRIQAIKDNPERFGLILEIWAHRVAILALPLSAGLLSLVYAFQRRFYVFDHLIFSMHSLSFQGLLLSTIFLLSLLGGWAWWLVIASPLHLYKHLRGTYGSSRVGTLVRMLILMLGTLLGFVILCLIWVVMGLSEMGGH